MAEGLTLGADRPADPCVMVIFGAAGDLTTRKLLPSLYNLARHGLLSPQFAVVGTGADRLSDEDFRTRALGALTEFSAKAGESLRDEHKHEVFYVEGHFEDPGTYQRLKDRLTDVHQRCGTRGNVLFYLATPPEFFGPIAKRLAAAGLVRPFGDPAGWTRIVIEKPFGRDLDSARELDKTLLEAFDERQIHRIDHYLGKETVQNILTFRFINSIFEPIWTRRYVDHVQLTVAETLGVEQRGAYYETAGALRDIVQNHMFQLLCLIAMEPPISFGEEAVRNEKVKVLQAIRPMTPDEILTQTVRGQYGPGLIDGAPVPAYRAEPHVAATSCTETFTALRLFIENWRWADVPFYLRTGKRLARHETEIVIQFRRAPLNLLPARAGRPEPNRLTLHIQPDERITLRFQAKRPGPHIRIAPVEMEFAYTQLEGESLSTGYETLLYDCMIGDQTLFYRADMVDAAWEVASPILDVWEENPPADFPNYAAGSWGPRSADALMVRDGREWLDPF